MKLSHPFSVAAITGVIAAIASIFFHAGAQAKTSDRAAEPAYATAVFAGGCFWCVESDFDKLGGVIETISGYTGGTTVNPTYKTHSKQGHLEAVKVVYDPALVTYDELVDYFIHHIDPTDAGGQFCDRGHSYTTAIFVSSPQERAVVESQFAAIRASNVLPGDLVTAIREPAPFYAAEGYHQDYYLKNATRYNFYRKSCGRDRRVREVWAGEGNS
ncbi:MAG: peptide-methionine (S)-S-oxide reductase MsrA [Alphaproteobacteria bacterium]|nr:peptide-methionine (S)-S-oxide reductase MsrA [Alphaproteobacteria bacterium]